VIKHDNPQADAPYALYAHLNSIKARQGQRVKAGQIIGTMGNTAASKTDAMRVVPTHLHFELLHAWPPPGKDAGRVNPEPYFRPAAKPLYTSPYSAPFFEQQRYTPASGFSGFGSNEKTYKFLGSIALGALLFLAGKSYAVYKTEGW
jgi:hypothetical protein